MTCSGVFQNGMLLQREKQIPVWGSAEPGAEVRVTVGDGSWTGTTDSAGCWCVLIGPLAAGEGLEMTVASG